MNRNREVFQPYLERRFQQAGAITYGEKQQVIEQLIFETKEGQVPVSADQVIRLNRENPAVVAVREGQNISLDGRAETSTTASPQAKAKRNALYALLLLSIVPLLAGLWWLTTDGEPETAETVTLTAEVPAIAMGGILTATVTLAPIDLPQPTAIPTMTPLPTFTPVPIDPVTFEVEVTDERPLSANNNPIALQFLGEEYRVTTAPLTAAWEPEGIEWWPGTHVRRVLTMPYQDRLLTEVFQSLGDTILIRLRTGQAVAYTLEDIQRVHRLEIQHLTASTPSLVLILYGEADSDQRWLITGRAVQQPAQLASSPTVSTTTLDFLTVHTCTHTGNSVSCEVEVTDPIYLNQLTLTDHAWLDALDQLPAGETQPNSAHTAQLSGTVRGIHTAVIVWRADDQQAVHHLKPTDFEKGEP